MMSLNIELLKNLQQHAKKGDSISSLVELIKKSVDPQEFNSFVVLNYFMQAFELTFSQVKEMPGAFCLGGGVYSDEEINEIIYKHINNVVTKSSDI